MPSRLRNFASMLLHQLPAVLALGVLGTIAWWGYIWDWKIPTLPELLHPSEGKEEEKKAEEKEPENVQKALPPFKLDSKAALEVADIKPFRIEPQWVPEYVKANGDIEFDQNRYAHLSTRASGTVHSVHKRQGDTVKKGEVLALIASPELARLKFDLQQTLLMVQSRESIYRRLQSTGKILAEKDRESAEFAMREARVALSKDQQSLQNLGLNVPLDEFSDLSDEQISARLRTLGISDSLLPTLDNGPLSNNLLPMIAPFDGIVIKRDIVRGETVSPQTPQFQLADVSRLWLTLHVRLEDAGKLALGQKVTFHLDGPNEDAPPAKINWISAEVDEKTRTVAARAEVANLKGRLRPHTFGSADIVVNEEKRLTVPNEALQFDGTSYVVFACGETEMEFQPLRVKLGPPHKGFTVILDGIAAGQTIATSGTRVLLAEMLKERIGGED
jgi:cobalt-zinc-cadmium efflux system membrane fusion protein